MYLSALLLGFGLEVLWGCAPDLVSLPQLRVLLSS